MNEIFDDRALELFCCFWWVQPQTINTVNRVPKKRSVNANLFIRWLALARGSAFCISPCQVTLFEMHSFTFITSLFWHLIHRIQRTIFFFLIWSLLRNCTLICAYISEENIFNFSHTRKPYFCLQLSTFILLEIRASRRILTRYLDHLHLSEGERGGYKVFNFCHRNRECK